MLTLTLALIGMTFGISIYNLWLTQGLLGHGKSPLPQPVGGKAAGDP